MTFARPLLLALLVLAMAAPSAHASVGALLRECQSGSITGAYTQAQFNAALRNIPTDADEYSDCRAVLRSAQLKAAGGRTGGAGDAGGGAVGAAPGATPAAGGTGGGSAEALLAGASPAERAAVASAIGAGGAAPVTIAGRRVSPKAAGLSPAGAANVLPAPLVVVLVLLGVGLLVALARAASPRLAPLTGGLRARVRARRRPTG